MSQVTVVALGTTLLLKLVLLMLVINVISEVGPPHQQRRYVPAVAVILSLPKFNDAPLCGVAAASDASGNPDTGFAVPHVSSTAMELPSPKNQPTIPSTLHVSPLTHVRACTSRAGPTKSSSPTSTRKSAATLQAKPLAHQHSRYCPPDAENTVEPQLTTPPLAVTPPVTFALAFALIVSPLSAVFGITYVVFDKTGGAQVSSNKYLSPS
jgi:hypothetical protein